MTEQTVVQPQWGIRSTGYLITGTALWGWFAWQQFADPFVVAAIVTAVNVVVSELLRFYWVKRHLSA